MNGISCTTRMIGCAYLYPQVIPNPHFFSYALHPDDEFIIMANKGLWDFIGYQEAVEEVRGIYDPVAATKKLQDLAQAYGSKENIGILILRIKGRQPKATGTNGHVQSATEKPLEGIRLAAECHDKWGLDDWGSVYSLSTTTTSDFEPVSFTSQSTAERQHSVSSGTSQKLKSSQQNPDVPDSEKKATKPAIPKKPKNLSAKKKEVKDESVLSPTTHPAEISIRPLPRQRITDRNPAEEWESILQDRLSEEVKNKELQYMWGPQEETIDMDSSFGAVPPNGTSSNWSTVGKKKGDHMAAQINEKDKSLTTIDQKNEKLFAEGISSPPWSQSQLVSKLEEVVAAAAPAVEPDPEPGSPPPKQSDDEYIRYAGPTVDRDALLFHQMNQARAKSCSMASIDTVKSDVGATRSSGVLAARCAPISHSIEVIVRDDPDEGYEPHEEYIPEEGEVFEEYDECFQGSVSSLDEDSFSEGSFVVSDLDLHSNSSSLIGLAPRVKRPDIDRTPTNSASEETLKNSEKGIPPSHPMYHNLNKLQTASQYSVAQISNVSSSSSVPSVATLVVTQL